MVQTKKVAQGNHLLKRIFSRILFDENRVPPNSRFRKSASGDDKQNQTSGSEFLVIRCITIKDRILL